MRISSATRHPQTSSEDGYILLGVILLLVVFMIAMAVAAPRVADSIQRDRDLETMHRGKQYIRAIQLYFRKFKRYPPSLDALEKTNEIRFLRKKYVDPVTGKEDWKPIQFGQNKTPMAMGFFGQPLAGTGGAVLAGIGPADGNGLTGATSLGGDNGSSQTGGLFPTSGTGAAPTSGLGGATDASGAASGGTDANGNPTGTTFGAGAGFGGGGIIGVAPASPKQSILIYKKKTHYNEWEFLYSPLMEQQMVGGGGGQQLGGGGQPLGGSGQKLGGGGLGLGGGGLGLGGAQQGGGLLPPGGDGGGSPISPPTTSPQPPQ